MDLVLLRVIIFLVMYLIRCDKMVFVFRILLRFMSFNSCKGWYWGKVGERIWVVLKRFEFFIFIEELNVVFFL